MGVQLRKILLIRELHMNNFVTSRYIIFTNKSFFSYDSLIFALYNQYEGFCYTLGTSGTFPHNVATFSPLRNMLKMSHNKN